MTISQRIARALPLFLITSLLPLPVQAQAQVQTQAQVESAPAPAADSQTICGLPLSEPVAAPKYTRPNDPWIYRGTDIPVDGEWLMGEMPNGLRYAVRKNGVPPCQVSMRVRIDAGALYERQNEQGYAHLIEHMVFRQSRYFADSEAIPFFQRLGARLGYDTNALTTHTQTVFKLDLPNAQERVLTDSIRRFAGMIREPALSAENLAADVPIVLAEKRERAGPGERIANAMRETLFAGQPYASRIPIGTVETLQGATAQSVQAFHRRWYRPDNAVVVLVGEADPQVLAAYVERYFGDWEVPGKLTPQPDFGSPRPPAGSAANDNDDGVPVGDVRVIVEAGQPRSITYAILRPWVGVVDNLEYNRGILIDSIAEQVINRRLEERARSGGSFLYASVGRDKVSRSADATFVTLAPLGDDWETALAEVRGVIADALAEAPSQEAIDREVAEYDIAFVDMVGQSEIQAGAQLADTVVDAVDIREAIAAPETFLSVFREMNDRFTPEAILEHTRALFQGEVMRAVMLAPAASPGEDEEAQLRAALMAPADASMAAQAEGAVLGFDELPSIGETTPPVSIEPMGFDTLEQLEFPNGVRAMIYGRDNEPGRVTVRVRFGGGWRSLGEDEAVYAMLGRMAMVSQGFGEIDQNGLDRLASGRKLTFNFNIEDGAFTFEGLTRSEDLADQLYLFAAKLADPRFDAPPVERAKASALQGYAAYGRDPNGVLARDFDYLMRGSDPRFATPTPAQISAATPEEFARVWSRLLAQGPLEVAVFGDIDRDATIAALSRTFGALPAREPLDPEVAARTFAFPEANDTPLVLTHSGDADQAAAVIAWPTGGGSDRLPEARKLDLLAQLLGNRLLDAMRERSGASYSPTANSVWPLDLAEGGTLFAMVQLRPGDVPAFFEEADRIVADLATNGPTADEMARVLEPIRQYLGRAQTGHTFWLNQLEGATFDINRMVHLRGWYADYADTTPEEVQLLAQYYLAGEHGAWRLVVLPESMAGNTAAVTGR